MCFDVRECLLQLKALFRLCLLRPNSWREVVLGFLTILLLPLVILVCVAANIKKRA
jgi:hypothetical protein